MEYEEMKFVVGDLQQRSALLQSAPRVRGDL